MYGDSLILEGVRAELVCNPGLEVIMLEFPLKNLLEELRLLNPAVIIFDMGAIQPDFPLAMLQRPDLLLIGINPETHQALVWSGKQSAAVVAADLLEIVQNTGTVSSNSNAVGADGVRPPSGQRPPKSVSTQKGE